MPSGLVAPEKKSRAVAVMFAGLTVANVLGVPFGAFVGERWGWRAAFWAVTGIGVLALAGIVALVPGWAGQAGPSAVKGRSASSWPLPHTKPGHTRPGSHRARSPAQQTDHCGYSWIRARISTSRKSRRPKPSPPTSAWRFPTGGPGHPPGGDGRGYVVLGTTTAAATVIRLRA